MGVIDTTDTIVVVTSGNGIDEVLSIIIVEVMFIVTDGSRLVVMLSIIAEVIVIETSDIIVVDTSGNKIDDVLSIKSIIEVEFMVMDGSIDTEVGGREREEEGGMGGVGVNEVIFVIIFSWAWLGMVATVTSISNDNSGLSNGRCVCRL